MSHPIYERKVMALVILTLITVCVGGMVEILPMMFDKSRIQANPNVKPLPPLQLAGRDIYIREGCHVCHTQMVRALAFETQRYGPYSTAGEDIYEHPFLWGSKRTGPDLARVGGRYSDAWHQVHLMNPRTVVPASNMPSYPWLFETSLADTNIARNMTALSKIGVPYTETDIDSANKAIASHTESEALIAYLQSLRAEPLDTPTANAVAP